MRTLDMKAIAFESSFIANILPYPSYLNQKDVDPSYENTVDAVFFKDNSTGPCITAFHYVLEPKFNQIILSKRYTQAYRSKRERNAVWKSLLIKSFIESAKAQADFKTYRSFNKIFFSHLSGLNHLELLHEMKYFFGKIPVPYMGNHYNIKKSEDAYFRKLRKTDGIRRKPSGCENHTTALRA